MKVNKRTWIVAAVTLALILLSLPLVSACASPQAKPGQVLKIGMLNPATGVAAEKGRDAAQFRARVGVRFGDGGRRPRPGRRFCRLHGRT